MGHFTMFCVWFIFLVWICGCFMFLFIFKLDFDECFGSVWDLFWIFVGFWFLFGHWNWISLCFCVLIWSLRFGLGFEVGNVFGSVRKLSFYLFLYLRFWMSLCLNLGFSLNLLLCWIWRLFCVWFWI